MKSLYQHKNPLWIDLDRPKDHEVKEILAQFNINEALAPQLVSPSVRHTIEFGANYAYLALHFPVFKDAKDDAAYEFDFVISPNLVITAHYSHLPFVEEFKESVKNGLASEYAEPRDAIFFGIINTLIADFDKKLVKVDHWVRGLERGMFTGSEKNTIFEISEASRHLIDFKKITAVYPSAFKELADKGLTIFGSEFAGGCSEILETLDKLQNKLDLLTDSVKELRNTNDAILTTKQNESMRVLSIAAVVVAALVGIALVWVGLLAVR